MPADEPEEPDSDEPGKPRPTEEPEPTAHHADDAESIFEGLEKAKSRAQQSALQKEQRKKPKFVTKQVDRKERDHAIDRFHKLLTTAAQPGSQAEGEKAELAARQMIEDHTIDPTEQFLDYAGKGHVGGSGHYYDNLLLAKLRQEHRQQWRQSVAAENLQREEHDALLLRLTPEQHEALSKKWSSSGAYNRPHIKAGRQFTVARRIVDMKAALGETVET
jgi:hypothetical protein